MTSIDIDNILKFFMCYLTLDYNALWLNYIFIF